MHVCNFSYSQYCELHNFVQVAWIGSQEKLTWVPSSALSQEMINEFEQGIACHQNIETNYSYGVMKHTITVSKGTTGPPPAKKVKIPPATFPAETM